MQIDDLLQNLVSIFPEMLSGIQITEHPGFDIAFDISQTQLKKLYSKQHFSDKDGRLIAQIQEQLTDYFDTCQLQWGYGAFYQTLLAWYQ